VVVVAHHPSPATVFKKRLEKSLVFFVRGDVQHFPSSHKVRREVPDLFRWKFLLRKVFFIFL